MKTNLLFIVAIIAIIITFVNFSVSFARLVSLRNILTGLSLTPQGYVNLTVSTSANINFSRNTINFGPGVVDTGVTTNASMDSATSTCTRGNWSFSNQNLTLDNIGNINVSLNLTVASSAATFLGGTNPGYFWNMTLIEAGSCTPATSIGWWNATTTAHTKFCNNFSYLNGANSLKIDIMLHVPYNSRIGDISDILTATATTGL